MEGDHSPVEGQRVVRATLHDELMREAGFDSDYYAELGRRRQERRRKLKIHLLRAVRIVAVVVVLVVPVFSLLDILRGADFMVRAPYLFFGLPLLVAWAAEYMLDRMRDEGEPKGLLRRFSRRCYRAGVKAWRRAARKLESEA
jgi:hypothetical protein